MPKFGINQGKPRYIVIEHHEDTPKVEAFGFEGQGCQVAVANFANLLGGEGESEAKPEYYVRPEFVRINQEQK